MSPWAECALETLPNELTHASSCPARFRMAQVDNAVLAAGSESTRDELAYAARQLAEPVRAADRLRGGARKR
jgi:hypothetical protein